MELVDNLDGSLSIFATIVDHPGPASHRDSISGPLALAALSRELSVNDWQNRTDVRRGGVEDRNVELVVPAPFLRRDRIDQDDGVLESSQRTADPAVV